MRPLSFPINLISLTPSERACCEKILANTGGLVARHFNKRISLPISVFLARSGVTPNQITFFNLILGIFSGLLGSLGGYSHLLEAAFLFQIVSILDGCDGEVAKLNQKTTSFGAWFDTVGDNLAFVLFITGITLGLYRETQSVWIVYLAKLSLISFAILLCIMISYLIRNKNSTASLVTYDKEVVMVSAKKQKLWISRSINYGKLLVKKDFFTLLFLLMALLGYAQGIVIFAALGTTAVAIFLMVITFKGLKRAPHVAVENSGVEKV